MTDKLNKKYYPFIWIALVVSAMFSAVYSIYIDINDLLASATTQLSNAQLAISILRMLAISTIGPVAVCVLGALIIYTIGFRRYVRCISRRDFCYFVMIAMSIVNMIEGIINIFALLNPMVWVVGTSLFTPILHIGAIFVLYFAVLDKKYKFNPVEKQRTFLYWVGLYTFIVAGVQLLGHLGIVGLQNSIISQEVVDLMESYGMQFVLGEAQFYISLVVIIISVLEIVAVFVINAILKRQADAYRDPQTREDFVRTHQNQYGFGVRDDVHSTYDEFDNQTQPQGQNPSKDKENVFDEFDI